MGSNMYPSASASLFSNHKDESLADVPVEQLIENADAFAAVFPGWLRRVFFVHEHDLSLYSDILVYHYVSARAKVRDCEEVARIEAYM